MTTEHTATSLRFVGDWPWWAGVTGSLVLAAAAWVLYRRDVRQMGLGLRLALPGMRALAVGMIVLMLSGPVLHHRTIIGQLSRVRLYVDGSLSMTLTDASMDLGRKIRILQRLGMLREDAVNMDLPKASDALGDGQTMAESAPGSQTVDTSEWNRLLSDFAGKMDETRDLLAKTGDGGTLEKEPLARGEANERQGTKR